MGLLHATQQSDAIRFRQIVPGEYELLSLSGFRNKVHFPIDALLYSVDNSASQQYSSKRFPQESCLRPNPKVTVFVSPNSAPG
jgi:hypothetical protein